MYETKTSEISWKESGLVLSANHKKWQQVSHATFVLHLLPCSVFLLRGSFWWVFLLEHSQTHSSVNTDDEILEATIGYEWYRVGWMLLLGMMIADNMELPQQQLFSQKTTPCNAVPFWNKTGNLLLIKTSENFVCNVIVIMTAPNATNLDHRPTTGPQTRTIVRNWNRTGIELDWLKRTADPAHTHKRERSSLTLCWAGKNSPQVSHEQQRTEDLVVGVCLRDLSRQNTTPVNVTWMNSTHFVQPL